MGACARSQRVRPRRVGWPPPVPPAPVTPVGPLPPTQVYEKLPLFDDRDLASFAQACAMTRRVVRQDFLNELLQVGPGSEQRPEQTFTNPDSVDSNRYSV